MRRVPSASVRFGQLHLIQQAAAALAETVPFFRLRLQIPAGQFGAPAVTNPLLRRRPADDQHLMGDIHPAAQAVVEAGGQEPMIDQRLVDAVENLRIIGHAAQFVHGKLATGVRSALPELHQTEDDPPRDPPLLGGSSASVASAFEAMATASPLRPSRPSSS